MSDEIIQFQNCRIIRGHALIEEDLWVRNGRIINPEVVFFDEKTFAHRRIDCSGAIIAPGFIDLQINGNDQILCFILIHKYTFCTYVSDGREHIISFYILVI